MIFTFFLIASTTHLTQSFNEYQSTRSIEELLLDYEDDRNAIVAVTEKDTTIPCEDFYEEIDARGGLDLHSINIIYYGPTWAFMRLDTESILHILVNSKRTLIPLSRVILAWDLVTDGLTPAFLQGREYLAFGELLNVVPEEDLYYVNFGDSSVLRYFAFNNVELSPRKYGILASAYRRYYGDIWFTNSSYINELGYILCGFPSEELARIQPEIFVNINVDVFSKLRKCSKNQTMTLYKIATHPKAYGYPHQWTYHDINRLEYLFTCIHEDDISSIRLAAVSAVSAAVIHDLESHKVLQFTKTQILNFNSLARREYILKMQLVSNLPLDKISLVSKSVSDKSIFILTFFIIGISVIY